METSKGRSITPEKVVRILDKHGTKVTLEEAKNYSCLHAKTCQNNSKSVS